MKTLFFSALLLCSSIAFAHPDATFIIDNDKDVTVTFKKVGECADGEKIRTLTFSEKAEAAPYGFVSGYFVESHNGDLEVYVQTETNCEIIPDGAQYPAKKGFFAGYSLVKLP